MSTKPAPPSTTHLPAAHFLESWGDSLAYDTTTYLCQQPLILPLYDGISELDCSPRWPVCPRRREPEHVQETFAELDRRRQRRRAAGTVVRRMPGTNSSTMASTQAASFPIPGGLAGMLSMQQHDGRAERTSASRGPSAPARRIRTQFRPRHASTTAATPTTAGSRNCPIPSASSPGTTRST